MDFENESLGARECSNKQARREEVDLYPCVDHYKDSAVEAVEEVDVVLGENSGSARNCLDSAESTWGQLATSHSAKLAQSVVIPLGHTTSWSSGRAKTANHLVVLDRVVTGGASLRWGR